jgi:hypothetical protein
MNVSEGREAALVGDDAASVRVLDAVADAEQMDPARLTPPLYAAIDPEALDALVGSFTDSSARIEFTYRGHAITVTGAGDVDVRPTDGR